MFSKTKLFLLGIIAALLFAAAIGLALRFALPDAAQRLGRQFFNMEPEIVYTRPEVVTVHDTVPVIDSSEVKRWRDIARAYSDTINLLRRYTVSQPTRIDTIPQIVYRDTGQTVFDTVWMFAPLVGIDAMYAPQEWGDSTIIRGFRVYMVPDSGKVALDRWRANYFTAGCIRSVVIDSIYPSVAFWPAQGKPCGWWCKRKHELLGGALGVGIGVGICKGG